MEQEIRFLQVGGKRLAYAVAGEGPLLVLPSWWLSHLELDWRTPPFRAFVEGLARHRTVVRYDRLGVGLSDRSVHPDTTSLESETDVLEALVDELGGERVALFGSSCGGCIGAAYAARRPERVDSLVVYGSYAHGAEIGPPEVLASMASLVRASWGFGSRMLADVFVGRSGEDLERYARYQRDAASAETAAALLELVHAFDVRDALARLRAPTLVLHRRGDRAIPFRLGLDYASRVAGARFVPLSGREHLPWLGDAGAILRATNAFLGIPVSDVPGARSESPLSERERQILALVASGLSNAEIALELVLSPHTVHRHVANIRRKLHQPSRAAAVAEAARLELI